MKAKPARKMRQSPRRTIETLKVSSVSILENNLTKIAKYAEIVEASVTGFLLIVRREDFIPKILRQNLNVDSLIESNVLIHISQMDLEITGKVVRTRLLGKQGYEIGVDYREDAPEYWRECLLDLLPSPGEISED